jgi:hypothetical protein
MTTCAKCGEPIVFVGDDSGAHSAACSSHPLRVELRTTKAKLEEWKTIAIGRRELHEREDAAWEAQLEERDTDLRNLRAEVLRIANNMAAGLSAVVPSNAGPIGIVGLPYAWATELWKAAGASEPSVAKIAALVRERDLLSIDRDLTPEEAAELAKVYAFLNLPENDGPETAAVRKLLRAP